MKTAKPLLAALLLMGSLGSSAMAANEGVLSKEELTPGSYCHKQFQAIDPNTVYGNNPQVRSSDSTDIIDYYGSCDETALSKDQVESQRLDAMRRHNSTYDD